MHIKVKFTLKGQTKLFFTNLLVEDSLTEDNIRTIVENLLERKITIIDITKI